MSTIEFETREFPTNPEGDLVYNNGQPRSALASWLKGVLSDHHIDSKEIIQEDYGWGFWLDAPSTIWVAVSYGGDSHSDNSDDSNALWYVTVAHEIALFTLDQWLRRKQGKVLKDKVFTILHQAIEQHHNITVLSLIARS